MWRGAMSAARGAAGGSDGVRDGREGLADMGPWTAGLQVGPDCWQSRD